MQVTINKARAMKTGRQLIWSAVRAVLMIGLCFIIIRPVLVKVIGSLMTEASIYDRTVKWIPRTLTLEHYRTVIEAMNYWSALLNTACLTIITSVLQVFSSAVIGYGAARFDFRGRDFLFALVVFTIILPPQTIAVSLFLNFRFFNIFGLLGDTGLNLIGTYWPFILTSLTGTGYRNGLFIFIMRQFFKGMPRDLEEAAYVDGAGPLATFFRVMLPGAVPGLVTTLLFAVVWQWNDLFYTSMYLQGGMFLPFRLTQFQAELWEQLRVEGITLSGYYQSFWNNAAMILFMSPLLILYAVAQRYYVESIQRTGLVG